MKQKTEILIIGAGVPGLALARSLIAAGLKVLVIDQGPAPQQDTQISDGRTAAIMLEQLKWLEGLGIKDLNKCAKLEALRLIDPHAHPEIDVTFHAQEIGLDYYGRNVPVMWLRSVLLKGIEKFCHFEKSLKAIEHNSIASVTAALSEKTKIEAQLIIGADSRNSAVRELSSIPIWQHDYTQTAITCVLKHTRPHHNVSTEFHYNGGPFTIVPLEGNRSSLVWLEREKDAQQILRLNKKDLIRQIQKLSHGVIGEIDLETNPHHWPIRALKAQSLTAKRTALAAEAAHVVPPTGAQGLNLSLRDMLSLSHVIIPAFQRGEDIGAETVLNRYADARKSDINSRVSATDALNRFILSKGFGPKALKQTGMRFFSIPSSLRRFVMQQGLAPENRVSAPVQRKQHKH